MKKNQVDLCDSFDLLVEASEHEMKYPSTAEDSSSTTRRVQYILTRVLNKLNNLIEVSDTQAVAGLVRFDAGQCSDIFWVYDSKSIENYMLDEKCPNKETDKISVRSDEGSLSENDSLKEFVVDGGEDDNLEDEAKVNRTPKGKGTDTALSSKETSRPSHAIQKVVMTTQKKTKINQACEEAKKNSLDTEMDDAVDKGGERSISVSVYDPDESVWLEKTNAAEMLACEASYDTKMMGQWSDPGSFDGGEQGEKLEAKRMASTSRVGSDNLFELKREVLDETRLYVSSNNPIGVPNFNHSFCYIASALQMLRDHTHEILSSPHEFQVSHCDWVMERSEVITNMHTLFKGVIACMHLNNGVGFVHILEAFFDATELDRGNRDVTEFWDNYILPSLRSIGLGGLFDIRTTSVIQGWNAEFGVQRREVTNTATGWIAVPVSESVQVGLDSIIGCARDKQDWIGPSYDSALPEGGEQSLSASEREALRLRHKTENAQEIEFVPESANSLVVKINRQMQVRCEKKTDVMEVEQVRDLFLSRDDVPLTTSVFSC